MLKEGFRFGMLLQIAVGPICFFIFQTAAAKGFLQAETGVLAVALIDALYILAAILGIGAILNKNKKTKTLLTFLGSFVLILFGLSNLLGVFDISLLPGLHLTAGGKKSSVFLQTLLLTLSNPLTILFWTGVLGTKIANENKQQKDLYVFGLGAVIATLTFLSFIALLGGLLKPVLQSFLVSALNAMVGLLLVYFGCKTLWKYFFHESVVR